MSLFDRSTLESVAHYGLEALTLAGVGARVWKHSHAVLTALRDAGRHDVAQELEELLEKCPDPPEPESADPSIISIERARQSEGPPE